jgi:hypothetical protein
MLETFIMMSLLIFCLIFLLVLHLISFIDLTIAHMVLVHKRIALCLDALVMAHVFIVVIVPRMGTVFLLEGLTLAFSQDTWTFHVFHIVVHVPLAQMVRWKGLWRLPQVYVGDGFWLHLLWARFLWFFSVTPALSHQSSLTLCRWWILVAQDT